MVSLVAARNTSRTIFLPALCGLVLDVIFDDRKCTATRFCSLAGYTSRGVHHSVAQIIQKNDWWGGSEIQYLVRVWLSNGHKHVVWHRVFELLCSYDAVLVVVGSGALRDGCSDPISCCEKKAGAASPARSVYDVLFARRFGVACFPLPLSHVEEHVAHVRIDHMNILRWIGPMCG